MTKVSVVVPTFNRAHILGKTLDSILNQTFQDFEVIVISNGSTDNTESVVNEYQDSRVKFFHQTGSGSPASPRNKGIREAKGEFIAFCDDDDLWLPTKLEKQLDHLLNYPLHGLCYTKMQRFCCERFWVNLDEEAQEKESFTWKELLYRNVVPLSSVVVRKNLLQEIGFFDESKSIAGAEDYELILRLSRKTQIFCIPEYLIHYYSGEERFSNASASTLIKRSSYYLFRLFYVYEKVVSKGFFNWAEMIVPFFKNAHQVLKIIIYSFLKTKRKSL